MNDKADFTQGSILKKLIAFMIPVLGALILQAAYGAVDLLVVGRFGSTSGLSAVSTGSQVLNLVTFVVTQFAMGITVLIARYLGEKRPEQIGSVIGGSAVVFTMIAVGLFIVMVGFAHPISVLMQAPKEAVELTSVYVRICGGGIFFIVAYNLLSAIFRGLGDSKSPLLFVFVACIVNVIGDLVLVAGLHMDAAGAALATVISQCVSCIWVVAFLFGKKTVLRLKAKNFFVSPKLILPCLALGLATFIMQSSESVISVCFNSSLLKYGGDIAVGAMTILTSVMQFAMLPMQGISQGSQPIISYNYGAGNSERVKKTFKLLLGVCLTYSFLLWGLIELFPQGFAKMFCSDAALIDFTANALRIYCAVLCLFGIQMTCQMAFVSIGSALCSISVAVVRKFVLLLPLIYIMPMLASDKTMGVYMAEPVADVIAITFTSILFAVQFGKAMKKLEGQKKEGV